ncbi:lipopolysaccharide assembly protein LapB [Candidatus Cyanaurora vandensis]|uniref:tetratricopeptide repeat protein n=1 Tax=Candidatus Cyanaurora vandensis TaxID=2714958 RepID=UPI00257D7AC7|nr:tetratricopeptide repeat protein [Candidatus Cyanaurora vandensis]
MQNKPESVQRDICALLEQRGQAYVNLGQYEKARFEFQGALTAARAIRDTHRECALLIELGNCEFLIPQGTDKAREWYHTALNLYQAAGLNHPLFKARLLVNLGHLEIREGRIDQAEQSYEAAVLVGREVDAKLIYRRSLEGKAVIAAIREDWQAGVTYLLEAITVVAVPLMDNFSVWDNLGYCYIHLGQHEAAERELSQMVALAGSSEAKEYKARALFKLGLNAELQSNSTEALTYYQSSSTAQETPEVLIALARLYQIENQPLSLLLAQQGQILLEQEPFSPLTDYTLEWTTLLRIRESAAVDGANRWIMEVLKCLPPSFPFWKSLARRNLLRMVKSFETAMPKTEIR